MLMKFNTNNLNGPSKQKKHQVNLRIFLLLDQMHRSEYWTSASTKLSISEQGMASSGNNRKQVAFEYFITSPIPGCLFSFILLSSSLFSPSQYSLLRSYYSSESLFKVISPSWAAGRVAGRSHRSPSSQSRCSLEDLAKQLEVSFQSSPSLQEAAHVSTAFTMSSNFKSA